MWEMEPTTLYERRKKHYAKKHPSELASVLSNLHRYLKMLNELNALGVINAGYLHPEPNGVKAIDQRSGGKNLAETRLYTFANVKSKVLYLITIGNKDSQPEDIKDSKKFVEFLKKEIG